MACGFTISNLLIPKAVQSNTASPYGKQLRYNKCSTRKNQPTGTDLHFQTVNQCYLWDVEKWYGVPHARSGKYWRKYVVKMANM